MFKGFISYRLNDLANTGSMQGSEIVKACILFGEKRCFGCNSKVCYLYNRFILAFNYFDYDVVHIKQSPVLSTREI